MQQEKQRVLKVTQSMTHNNSHLHKPQNINTSVNMKMQQMTSPVNNNPNNMVSINNAKMKHNKNNSSLVSPTNYANGPPRHGSQADQTNMHRPNMTNQRMFQNSSGLGNISTTQSNLVNAGGQLTSPKDPMNFNFPVIQNQNNSQNNMNNQTMRDAQNMIAINTGSQQKSYFDKQMNINLNANGAAVGHNQLNQT